MKFYLFIFIIMLSGCNNKKQIFIKADEFLPDAPKNTQYIYNFSTKQNFNNSAQFTITILEKVKDCVKVRDKFHLSENKIANPKSYKICHEDNTLIAKTTSNEFILFQNKNTWHSKVFSYYPIPKERAFIQECRMIKKYKEKIFNNLLNILEIQCSYINDMNTKILDDYKYASTIGLVEKKEFSNGIEVSHLILTGYHVTRGSPYISKPTPK